ncbi:septal ring lytic transglycosylase RlpA family protein [Marinobacter bryozoorum]|uniref:septal ring lytic transglycosylase RlpA family protein n=1 Tax=Marinobacter bryozoorum TaxID=256324 RepID=UPI00200300F2|nr:septal ring lytic transglycosylase RlpA family protein [Marinobacter bryozoorum]MCK7543910.1 septal ring lytic transglycosylase RlpA family protein [Marinobacter bryozoorum]
MTKTLSDLRLAAALAVLALVVAGCSSTPTETDHSGRYTIAQDHGPAQDVDVSGTGNAVPRYEAPRSAGNKSPYTVWGKQYRVMAANDADGYVQRGIASWYGKKFHGHKTSNGEIYDMYEMSAAHKSLPLPSYARVTNLDNGRSVIVRVNDRGPFHGDRLIDLSWAAAKKLDFLGQGTARVEVASITVLQDGSMTLAGQSWSPEGSNASAVVAEATGAQPEPSPLDGNALFVQLGSFSQVAPARRLEQAVRSRTGEPVRVRQITTASGDFHRVQVGPFGDSIDAERAMERLASEGFRQAMVLTDRH